MHLMEGLPDRVKHLLRSTENTEFTSISKAGTPIDTPLLLFPAADFSTIDVATGVAYPSKAERARRNPKVGLTIEGGDDDPVLAVAGMAAVCDRDIQANAEHYISEVSFSTDILNLPWEVAHKAVWYWSRIIIKVTPRRLMWWDNRAAMDGPPQVLQAPDDFVYPQSDPAPPGKVSEAVDWPEVPWRPHVQSFLDRNARGHLTLFDHEGFPIPIAAKSVNLVDDKVFELDMPEGAPHVSGGVGCFSFEGRSTFIGPVTGKGANTRLTIERTLPIMPMVIGASNVLLPEGKEPLMARLRHELARRNQPIPTIPAVRPEFTENARLRIARKMALES